MKIVFLNPQQEMGGVQCLSAFLKRAGHATALVNDPNLFDNPYVHFPRLASFFDEEERILDRLAAHRPGLIAVPAVSDDYGWALKWARRIKKRLAVPVVLGNTHPTYCPEEVLREDCVDFIVRGEGEGTLLELVEALEGGRSPADIPGLGLRENGRPRVNPMRPLIEDLDTLPFPDKDLYYSEMPYLDFGYTTMTGRGCPYHCTFCGNTSLMRLYREQCPSPRRWTRRHSPGYVVREVLHAKERWGITHVRFNDEDFTYDRKWLREFSALYAEKVRVPYSAWVYPNTVDREAARLLAESGCDTVEMGVQSGSERVRREILRRETSDDRIAEAMRALDEAGILVKADVIMGLPTETKADLDATARLLARGRLWNVFAFWLRYYPGTDIRALALERGYLPAVPAGADATAGFWVPEVKPDPLSYRYLCFFVLMPLFPRRLTEFILEKDLVRWFPGFFNAFLLSNIAQIVHRDPTGEFRVRGRRMLLAESAALLKRALRRVFAPRRPAGTRPEAARAEEKPRAAVGSGT